MPLRKPTPLGQKILEVSPEARAARRAQRITDRALPVGRTVLGRHRSSPLEGLRLLPLPSDVIPPAIVTALAHEIHGRQPLFDKFTKHYQVRPVRSSIEAYINGGVKVQERPPANDPKKVREFALDRRRQVLHIGDVLQRETFTNRNIAIHRRYALMTTQFLARHDKELDPQAAVIAADAIEDFGHTLNAHSDEILRPLHNEDLGYQIIVIGAVAQYDYSIMADNLDLLRLVQIEQRAREDHWNQIYQATVAHPEIGDRLTKLNHQDEAALNVELERLASLRQQ